LKSVVDIMRYMERVYLQNKPKAKRELCVCI